VFISQISAAARAARRILPVFGLAAALLTSSLGPLAGWTATPALADGPIVRDHRDPHARLELAIKRVIVHDDMDWGNGEIDLSYEVRSALDGCPPDDRWSCGQLVVSGTVPRFQATDGWVQTVDRVVPAAGDTLADSSVGPEIGIPIRPGQWYGLKVVGKESDPTVDDIMGRVQRTIVDENGTIRFGTTTQRGDGTCKRHLGFCSPSSSETEPDADGAFSVEFEIRRAPLPDLRPINITVDNLPNSPKQRVCAPVQNVGTGEAGPFLVSFYADGVALPGGEPVLPRLASADSSVLCIDTQLAAGPHQLRAVVDGPDRVVEFNERNNVYEQMYTAPAQAGSATPEQTSTGKPAATTGAAQADLTVSAIKVNGQVPDGKDDCKDGKNVVAVVVKNGGAAKADAVAVRLAVDGAEVGAQSVASLEPGKEREVRFADVSLKKGTHALTAVADPTKVITEANADNNELKVTVACKGDD